MGVQVLGNEGMCLTMRSVQGIRKQGKWLGLLQGARRGGRGTREDVEQTQQWSSVGWQQGRTRSGSSLLLLPPLSPFDGGGGTVHTHAHTVLLAGAHSSRQRTLRGDFTLQS